MKKRFLPLAVIILLAGGAGVWAFLASVGEMVSPKIMVEEGSAILSKYTPFHVTFLDEGQGVHQAEIALIQGGKRFPIAFLNHPQKGLHSKTITVSLDSLKQDISEGEAMLSISATDHSLWHNRTDYKKTVTIDLSSPKVELLTPTNHANQGGSCLIVYRISEETSLNGVKSSSLVNPGYPVSGRQAYVCYFSIPMDATVGFQKVQLIAKDKAGNETIVSVPILIKKRSYRSDLMKLSDPFLSTKMAEFQAIYPSLKGMAPIETFKVINTKIRSENLETIKKVCSNSEPRQLWTGAFLRMKKAAPMAMFGDKRTYIYEGKVVGDSLHNGIDLASEARAPVEAANTGVVRFSGPLGIYGNTVILDHGLGVFSLYAHLSEINAQLNQLVKRGDKIGSSGTTGLAGGDHLHFSIFVHGQFVDPLEWWDQHWINDNINGKINASI